MEVQGLAVFLFGGSGVALPSLIGFSDRTRKNTSDGKIRDAVTEIARARPGDM